MHLELVLNPFELSFFSEIDRNKNARLDPAEIENREANLCGRILDCLKLRVNGTLVPAEIAGFTPTWTVITPPCALTIASMPGGCHWPSNRNWPRSPAVPILPRSLAAGANASKSRDSIRSPPQRPSNRWHRPRARWLHPQRPARKSAPSKSCSCCSLPPGWEWRSASFGSRENMHDKNRVAPRQS